MPVAPGSSSIWKGILATRDSLKLGLCYQIYNGVNTKIWSNPWIHSLTNFKPYPNPSLSLINDLDCVNYLFNSTAIGWDITKLQAYFIIPSINVILAVKIIPTNRLDSLIRIHNKNGTTL